MLKIIIFNIILGSPFPVQVTRGQNIQVSGQCFHRLRLHDLGIFRIHCHGQRGQIDAKIFSKKFLLRIF